MKIILGAMLGILLTAFSAVKGAPTSQPTAVPHVKLIADIRYGEAPGKFNLLDLYVPEKADRPRPLIVFVHGGGWSAGDKSSPPGIAVVTQGYVFASINYRLAPASAFPAQIQDCKGAIRFLRAHADQYKIDPDRIGVWGASAGGHLVALLGTTAGSPELEGTVGGNANKSSRVQAVCDWFGPTDLSRFADQAQAAGIIRSTPGPSLILSLFGGTLQEKKELVQQANPISYVAKKHGGDIPPFLIMHGDKDALVPVAQSQMLSDALKAAGVNVDLRILVGAGHGTGFNNPTVAKTVLEFFNTQLKSKS